MGARKRRCAFRFHFWGRKVSEIWLPMGLVWDQDKQIHGASLENWYDWLSLVLTNLNHKFFLVRMLSLLALRRWKVAHMAQLVWCHACVANKLPVVVRIPLVRAWESSCPDRASEVKRRRAKKNALRWWKTSKLLPDFIAWSSPWNGESAAFWLDLWSHLESWMDLLDICLKHKAEVLFDRCPVRCLGSRI